MFNLNLYKLGILNLPLVLRKVNNIAWVKVVLALIEGLKITFFQYRIDQLFFLAHNSQVIYLEHILNFRFNPNKNTQDPNYEGNGIYIDDGLDQDETYIYNTSESGSDTFLRNSSEAPFDDVYLYNSSEMQPIVGFIVLVPDTFDVDENEIKALVNRLKLAGKRFTIKYYTI